MLLPSQRHLFDIPDDVAYLNCGYMSPLMLRVCEAGVAGLTRKARPWKITARDFFSGSDALRAAFAELVNARPDDIALVPAVSYGISVAARNLPLARGQHVIVVEDQFPSNVYPWRERAREVGARVHTVSRPIPRFPSQAFQPRVGAPPGATSAASAGNGEGAVLPEAKKRPRNAVARGLPQEGGWTQAVLAAIDDDTAIVALPHCHWIDGGLFDLERIGAECRRRGVALALDVTQSLGVLPLDVRRVQPDFLACAGYKWLLGPYAVSYLYVAERWQQGVPLEHNWIHRRNAEDFARLVDYQDGFEPGARRFDMGERSNFALLPAAEAALRQILEWGVDNVRETVEALADRIVERVTPLGLSVLPKSRRAPHYLGLQMAAAPPAKVLRELMPELARRNVYVSLRGSAIRVTPHVYNTEADVDRFVAALEAVLA